MTSDNNFNDVSPVDGFVVGSDGQIRPEEPVRPLGAQSPPERDAPPVVPSQAEPEPPVMAPEYVHPQDSDIRRKLEQQARQLAQPAANVDIHGMPHFERLIDGRSLCGGCGQEYPCDTARGMRQQAETSQRGADSLQIPPTMAEAAQAAGMDVAEFAERLAETRRL